MKLEGKVEEGSGLTGSAKIRTIVSERGEGAPARS
jgi:hypothetical protein